MKNFCSRIPDLCICKTLVLTLPLSLPGMPAWAQAHVHGEAYLSIVSAGAEVQVEFTSPAVNLLGFESTPGSSEELAIEARVKNQLGDYLSLFRFQDDSCQAIQQVVKGLDHEELEHSHEDEELAASADDHDHSHDEEHEHGDESHRDIMATYTFSCSGQSRLALEFTGFMDYPALEEVVVYWVTDSESGREELTPRNFKLSLP